MKKNIVISLLIVIIIIQSIALKNFYSMKITVPSQNSTDNSTSPNHSMSSLMDNPIDTYFSPRLNSKTEAEVRDAWENYEKTWEQEYNKVIATINNKCIYEQDKKNLSDYEQSVQELIKAARPILKTEFLDAYKDDPGVPMNRSTGNSTASILQGIDGQIYRDASMLLIPYIKDEYEFPVMAEK